MVSRAACTLYKVIKTFVCKGCMNPVTGTGRSTSADIGVNANLELVDKFCYLGEMLSVDGDEFRFLLYNCVWCFMCLCMDLVV